MDEVVRDASLHYVLPRTSLTPLLSSGMLSPREVNALAILQDNAALTMSTRWPMATQRGNLLSIS